jgi:prepilin-type N-terminal cleavage/methylation domain-containing protein/prepilin-type processing-associated H-X9-DG protein
MRRSHSRVFAVHANKGFSFIEMIVVLMIVVLLTALLLPTLIRIREASRSTQCRNNLKNIAIGMIQFHDTYRRLPASGNYSSLGRHHSWVVSILPYLDQAGLYRSLNLDLPIDDAANSAIQKAQIPVLLCPIDISRNPKRYGDLSYVVNSGVGFTDHYQDVRDCPTEFNRQPIDLNGDGNACSGDQTLDDLDRILLRKLGLFFVETWKSEITERHYEFGQVRDGLTNTLMLAENIRTGYSSEASSVFLNHVGDPAPQRTSFFMGMPCINNQCSEGQVDYSRSNSGKSAINSGLWKAEGESSSPNSFHKQGVNVAFADGHVIFLSEKISGEVYASLMSPTGSDLDETTLRQVIPDANDF